MQFRSLLLAAGLVLAAFVCRATPLTYNASDLWWDPNESGWGLNVIHQGDTLFATLFVFGPDGRPRWYSASNLVTPGDGPAHDRPLVFTGDLHESTGPAFGTPFNPSAVVRRRVGSMTLEVGHDHGNLSYSVDGVNVSKRVQRYVFRVMNIAGDYIGYQHRPASALGAEVNDAMTISIRQSGTQVTMTTQGSQSGACTYNGTLTPHGQIVTVSGYLNCANGRDGNFTMWDVDVTQSGFTTPFNGALVGPSPDGRMGGARTTLPAARGDGWRTDLWWVPSESGWGVNIIEQGESLFATIFTFDAQGRPTWYSASPLAYSGNSPSVDANGIYSGTVYESTGPYFGTAFNPNAVTRRAVGAMSFEGYGNRNAYINLDINGAQLSRKYLDRYTFRTNDVAGTYVGHLHANANTRNVPTGATTFDISTSGSTVTIRTTNAGGNCTFTANNMPQGQGGQQLLLVGPFTCSNGTSGNFFFYELDVSFSGFTAFYAIDGYLVGTLAGVRSGVF